MSASNSKKRGRRGPDSPVPIRADNPSRDFLHPAGPAEIAEVLAALPPADIAGLAGITLARVPWTRYDRDDSFGFYDPLDREITLRAFPADASYGRRLVRLGAQLCTADGTLINRDFARGILPGALPAGASTDIVVQLPAIDTPGKYALKFDMVYEGVDWFERCGSPTTTKPLRVL